MKKIDKARVCDEFIFATSRDRCLYIGNSSRDRVHWLRDNSDRWRLISDVLEDADEAHHLDESESCARTTDVGPSSSPYNNDRDDRTSVDIPHADHSPPLAAAMTSATVPAPGVIEGTDEITIGSRRYVTAQRLASMHGISVRTLSRLCRADDSVPKIRINNVYFEFDRISEWLAQPTRPKR